MRSNVERHSHQWSFSSPHQMNMYTYHTWIHQEISMNTFQNTCFKHLPIYLTHGLFYHLRYKTLTTWIRVSLKYILARP